ncbi:MAG: TadE/TadG family type IV pilus assembly protein [Acetobacteraceae bacterium]
MHAAHHGNAAIELVLAAPLLLVMLAGIVNVGYALREAMLVQNAAEAGALYAAEHGWDAAGISAAVTGSAGSVAIMAAPAPAQLCGCPGPVGVIVAACASACPSGGSPGVYIRISAALAHQQIVPYLGFGVPATLTGESLVRVQ